MDYLVHVHFTMQPSKGVHVGIYFTMQPSKGGPCWYTMLPAPMLPSKGGWCDWLSDWTGGVEGQLSRQICWGVGGGDWTLGLGGKVSTTIIISWKRVGQQGLGQSRQISRHLFGHLLRLLYLPPGLDKLQLPYDWTLGLGGMDVGEGGKGVNNLAEKGLDSRVWVNLIL